MSLASKSYIPVPVPTKQRRPRRKSVERVTPPVEVVTKEVKKSVEVSPRLKMLTSLQKTIGVVTFCLLGSTLGVYAWTMYIPKIWDKQFHKLETLQRYERHLLATNETIKHQLAEQAEKPESGLKDPLPSQAIFLRRQVPAGVKLTTTAPNSPTVPNSRVGAY